MMVIYSIAVVALIVSLVYFLYAKVKDKVMFYTLLLPLYSMVWQTISVLIVEYGFYITEQKSYSYFTGGAFRTLIAHSVFFVTYLFLANFFGKIAPRSKRNRNMGGRVAKVIVAWVVFGLMLSYVNVLLSPSPLFDSSVTRFNFMDESALPWVRFLTSERFFYAFTLIGALYAFYGAESQGKRDFVLGMYLALLLYLFLVGEKFTAPVLGTLIFVIFVLSSAQYKFLGEGVSRNIKIYASLFSVVVFSYVLYTYMYKYELSGVFGSPILAVLYRGFVLQGHTQWGLDALYLSGTPGSLSMWSNYHYSGMSIAMSAVAPRDVLAAFQNVTNASFSSAYPGVMLYTGGWVGVIFSQVMLGVVFLLFSRLFSWSIANRFLICSVLSMQAIYTLFYIYNMGNFNELLSVKFLVSTLLLVGVVYSRKMLRGKV